ncbi:recombinase family protein [Xanthomonas citri]|uniref:recombinase family protein n=1 Tax=Xanthomonas citri TaxID=346 RepID=UPI0022770A30|nr:recombinase family protein [Xanthomonas citri]
MASRCSATTPRPRRRQADGRLSGYDPGRVGRGADRSRRLGRSLVHLVQTIDALRERGVGFRSLTDAGIDTTTRNGKLLFNLFATLAEFERDLISERTKASLAAAKARGRSGGRRATVTPEKLAKARRLMDKKGLTVKEAAAALNVGRSTLYRALNGEGDTPTEGNE